MKLATLLASLGVVASSLVVVASAPAADAAGCSADTVGKHRFTMGKKSFHWTVRQHNAEENYTGSNETLTFKIDRGRSTTESVSVSAEVSASFKAGVFAEMEARVGTDLGHVGQKTTYGSITRNCTLKSGDVYHFVRGSGYYRAHVEVDRCSWVGISREHTYWSNVGDGQVRGFMPRTQSVVGCEQATDRGTLALYIQRRFCH